MASPRPWNAAAADVDVAPSWFYSTRCRQPRPAREMLAFAHFQLMTKWTSADDRLNISSFYSKDLLPTQALITAFSMLAFCALDVRARTADTDQMCKENKAKSVKIDFFFCKWRQGVKLLNMTIWWRIKSGRLTCRCYCVLSRLIEMLLYSSTQLCIIPAGSNTTTSVYFPRGLKSTVMFQFLTLDLLEI